MPWLERYAFIFPINWFCKKVFFPAQPVLLLQKATLFRRKEYSTPCLGTAVSSFFQAYSAKVISVLPIGTYLDSGSRNCVATFKCTRGLYPTQLLKASQSQGDLAKPVLRNYTLFMIRVLWLGSIFQAIPRTERPAEARSKYFTWNQISGSDLRSTMKSGQLLLFAFFWRLLSQRRRKIARQEFEN